MIDYLSIPQHRRDRATHEKARSLRPGELRWVRVYTDDLDELAGESPIVRFLDDALLRLASKRSWMLLYDPRRIASRLELPTRHVKPAIERLLALHRLEIVVASPAASASGDVQIGLNLTPDVNGSESPQGRRSVGAVARSGSSQGQGSAESVSDVSALIDDSLASGDPRKGRQTRARAEERREELSSNGTVASSAAADAHADQDEREIVNRLAALAARGDPRSAGTIRHWAIGAPDYIIARALESYRGRHPRPSNGGGYVVATLQSLRREAGIPDPPRIDREPAL